MTAAAPGAPPGPATLGAIAVANSAPLPKAIARAPGEAGQWLAHAGGGAPGRALTYSGRRVVDVVGARFVPARVGAGGAGRAGLPGGLPRRRPGPPYGPEALVTPSLYLGRRAHENPLPHA
jgi:hypothetical protein